MREATRLRVVPVTAERWADVERLFGPRGACGGCWCMTPRLPRAEYERQKGEGNRRALRRLVEAGAEPGVLAYVGTTPVAWCAIGPRQAFSTLARSRILKPVDTQPVWSIVCLFVDRAHRGRGVSVALIDGAARFAHARGAGIVEAYPVEPREDPMPAVFAYTGIVRRSPST